MNPSVRVNTVACAAPVIKIAPTTAIADIAFVSDISGVCSRGETRRINSKPKNAASMNTQIAISYLFICVLPSGGGGAHLTLHHFQNTRIHYLVFVRNQRFANNFVFQIDVERAFFIEQ